MGCYSLELYLVFPVQHPLFQQLCHRNYFGFFMTNALVKFVLVINFIPGCLRRPVVRRRSKSSLKAFRATTFR